MTMDLDANQLSFEVDSYALFVCKELVQILSFCSGLRVLGFRL